MQQVGFKYYLNVKENVSDLYFFLSFFLSVLPNYLLEVNIYPEGPATKIDTHVFSLSLSLS